MRERGRESKRERESERGGRGRERVREREGGRESERGGGGESKRER